MAPTTTEEFWTLFDHLLAEHFLPFVGNFRVHRHRSANMEGVWLDRVELRVWVAEEADGLCARARRTSLGRAEAKTHVFQWPPANEGYTFETFMPVYMRFTIANLALDMACAMEECYWSVQSRRVVTGQHSCQDFAQVTLDSKCVFCPSIFFELYFPSSSVSPAASALATVTCSERYWCFASSNHEPIVRFEEEGVHVADLHDLIRFTRVLLRSPWFGLVRPL
jgi:hypothetical protein